MAFTEVFNKTKRYVADIDFYVYAKDDEEAKEFVNTICQALKEKFDNQASPLKLVEKPFSSQTHREVELK